jgi:hypothetical protein
MKAREKIELCNRRNRKVAGYVIECCNAFFFLHPQIMVILEKTHGGGYEGDPNSLINIYQFRLSSTLKETEGLKTFGKFLSPCTACAKHDILNILSTFP